MTVKVPLQKKIFTTMDVTPSLVNNLTHQVSEVQQWSLFFREKLIPTAAVLAFYLLTGTFGNGLILFIHLSKMPRNDNRYFITVLSGVNLFACWVSTAFFFTLIYFNVNYPSDFTCKTFYFLIFVFLLESAGLIVVITIQRYLKLCRPNNQQMNDKHKKTAICLSVVTSLATGFPCFYTSGVGPIGGHLNITGTYCWIRTHRYYEVEITQTTVTAILLILFFVVNCVLYRKIGVVLIRLSIRRRQRLGDNQDSAPDRNAWEAESSFIQSEPTTEYVERRRRRPIHVNFYRMFLTMFCTYVIVFIPTICLKIVSYFDKTLWFNVQGGLDINFIHICQDLFMLKFSVDPIIYGYFDLAFRQKVVELFSNCCKR